MSRPPARGERRVRAARFVVATLNPDKLRELMRRMEGVEPARRSARFRTVCVACDPDRPPIVAEGALEGRITETPRGAGGFGYDPVFEVAGTGRTLAELSFAEKSALSHRAAAVANLVRKLRET